LPANLNSDVRWPIIFQWSGIGWRLVPGLRPARTRVLALFLLIRRRGLGRGARILIGPLKPEHQLDQLLFAELLQITAIHTPMDSEIAPPGKGVSNYDETDERLPLAQFPARREDETPMQRTDKISFLLQTKTRLDGVRLLRCGIPLPTEAADAHRREAAQSHRRIGSREQKLAHLIFAPANTKTP
jgi:hypothetical protein